MTLLVAALLPAACDSDERDFGGAGNDAGAGTGGTAGTGGGTGGGQSGGAGGTGAVGGGAGDGGTAGNPDVDAGPCDPVSGGGCPTGQKCGWIIDRITPIVEGHTGCQPLLGNATAGQSCTWDDAQSANDCAPGNYCDGNACRRVCDTATGCGTGFGCATTNIFTDRPGVGLCFETCDPVAQDCALRGEGCYFGSCWPAGSSTDHCNGVGGIECAPGYECLPLSADVFQCMRYCDPASASACGSTEACLPFSDILGADIPFSACVPQ